MFQEKRVIGLTCANKIELPILGRSAWRQMKRRTNRVNIHRFPKDVATGNIFPIDLDLSLSRRIVMQHPA